jgi:hypothetical protein
MITIQQRHERLERVPSLASRPGLVQQRLHGARAHRQSGHFGIRARGTTEWIHQPRATARTRAGRDALERQVAGQEREQRAGMLGDLAEIDSEVADGDGRRALFDVDAEVVGWCLRRARAVALGGLCEQRIARRDEDDDRRAVTGVGRRAQNARNRRHERHQDDGDRGVHRHRYRVRRDLPRSHGRYVNGISQPSQGTRYRIFSCTGFGISVRSRRQVPIRVLERRMIHPLPRVDRHEPLFAVCVTILVALLVAATALLTK